MWSILSISILQRFRYRTGSFLSTCSKATKISRSPQRRTTKSKETNTNTKTKTKTKTKKKPNSLKRRIASYIVVLDQTVNECLRDEKADADVRQEDLLSKKFSRLKQPTTILLLDAMDRAKKLCSYSPSTPVHTAKSKKNKQKQQQSQIPTS